jgi:hypothetical protein
VQQLRDQLWQLRNELATVDSRQSQRLSDVKDELTLRIEKIETWVENQRARHASTPVWLFGLFGMLGTTVSILVSLYMAGVL